MTKMLGMLPGMGDLAKMMSGADAEGEMHRKLGIIDSMTQQERRNPKIIEPSRRNRIARGAGVQVQEVNGLIKEFDMMAPLIKMMAGKGVGGRMQALQELQKTGAFDPGSKGPPKMKGDTGKRLTPKERAELKKKREKELRKKKREQKDRDRRQDGDSNDDKVA
jgi:signal recognition particle subunit SRP54